MSVCPSVCLSVCLSVHFAPTSQSWMSNIFRNSESLRKSNGKKWSNIGTFLFGSGLKSPRKKKVCLGPPSYGIGATICIGREMLCLPYAGFFSLITPLSRVYWAILTTTCLGPYQSWAWPSQSFAMNIWTYPIFLKLTKLGPLGIDWLCRHNVC